jgi:hypothetical protein
MERAAPSCLRPTRSNQRSLRNPSPREASGSRRRRLSALRPAASGAKPVYSRSSNAAAATSTPETLRPSITIRPLERGIRVVVQMLEQHRQRSMLRVGLSQASRHGTHIHIPLGGRRSGLPDRSRRRGSVPRRFTSSRIRLKRSRSSLFTNRPASPSPQ